MQDPRPWLLSVVFFAAALPAANVAKAGDADVIELLEPDQRLPAANPEEQAQADIAHGDYRFIWVHYLGGAGPVGVYCSLPLHMGANLSLGKFYVSDVVPNENAEAEARQGAFAARYNHAVVEDPRYPYRDVCRPWIEQDRDVLLDEPWDGRSLPTPRLYENVRPGQMPKPEEVMILQTAARLGFADRVHQLAASGADVDARDPFGLSPIAWAAARGHEAVVKELLDRGASVWPSLPRDDTEGLRGHLSTYPIFVAAAEGNAAIVQLLVSALDRDVGGGAPDPDTQNILDISLGLAARRGDLASVKALVEAGAPISVYRGDYGSTIESAMRQDNMEVIDYLLRKAPADENATPLHIAALVGRPILLRRLLENQADPNARNGHGETPIFWAARSNDADKLEKIDLLLKAGADPNARAESEQTPLISFSWRNTYGQNRRSAEVARRLYAAGVDLDARDKEGRTALSYALGGEARGRSSEDFELALALIELGADVNIVTNGKAVLDEAALISDIYGARKKAVIAALRSAGALTAAEIAERDRNASGDRLR